MIASSTNPEIDASILPDEPAAKQSDAKVAWLLAAQLPLVIVYGCYLWERPYYQCFVLVAPVAAWLAARRMREATALKPGKTLTVLLLLFGTLLLQAGALAIHSYWLIGISLPLALTAFLCAAGGWRLTYACWPSLALLCLCIPPPYAMDICLVTGLRALTSNLGSDALNAIRLPHLQSGNVFEVGGRELFVEDACSGINSLFSSLCCVLVWAALIRMHWITALILSAATVFWLLAANVLRVVLVAVGIAWLDVDLTSGWEHEALGVGTFALGLFLAWSTGQFMLFFLRPHPAYALKTVRTGVASGRLPSPAIPLSKTSGLLLLGATAMIALFYVVVYRSDLQNNFPTDPKIADRLNNLLEADLAVPKNWTMNEFKVDHRDRDDSFGEYSRFWRLHSGSLSATASVDFSFSGWHDLTGCYKARDWQMDEVNDIPSPMDDGSTIKEVLLKRAAFQTAYLLFGVYDRADQPVAAPPEKSEGFWVRRDTLFARLTGQRPAVPPRTTTYQVQVLLMGSGAPDAETRRKAADLFKATHEAAAARLAGQ
jgi:exosortase